ncbi:two-component system response regulator [Rhodoferax sp. OV413]|uniref:response regulator n=1 Tax=Rhodoferax sp. OV413 TaxID=1855285 RepID=UPI0025DDC5AB|nr:two-component system response regulator [Rhodoferax sp. OV413]
MQKVLVVDDTRVNLLIYTALLEELEDCEIHAFPCPLEGLAWAAGTVPDLVIVDYMMPHIDGLEFIHRFRVLPGCCDIPLVMITANDLKEVRYRALDAGANDFLGKPVDNVEFLARAKNMLSLSAARSRLADQAQWLTSEVRKATEVLLQRERDTVFRLCKAAEYRDPETGAHILRMAHYSQLIAKNLGMTQEEQDLLLEAAPMHDIGKVGISDNILLKPGRLTPEEFEIMKQHASFGYELLKDSNSLVLQAGAEIALGHHEKFDGSGYPQGLKGEEIPLLSRIVAVADVFDALTSERPYKKAWSLEQAIDFLNAGSGSHFDPNCVQAFLEGFDEVLDIRDRYQEED